MLRLITGVKYPGFKSWDQLPTQLPWTVCLVCLDICALAACSKQDGGQAVMRGGAELGLRFLGLFNPSLQAIVCR